MFDIELPWIRSVRSICFFGRSEFLSNIFMYFQVLLNIIFQILMAVLLRSDLVFQDPAVFVSVATVWIQFYFPNLNNGDLKL